jgi:hypothetical protein
LTTFSKHNFVVELPEFIPDVSTMLSHNDFTVEEYTYLSVGIFLRTSLDLLTSFLKRTSTSSKIPTKSLHGVTRPPLVRADMKLFDSADFIFCSNVRVKSNRDQPRPGNPRAFDLTLPPYRREFDGPVGNLTARPGIWPLDNNLLSTFP